MHQSGPTRLVREECTSLKCFDKTNFGKHTAAAPGLTTIGNGTSRTFKLKAGEAGLGALRQTLNVIRGAKE